MPENKLTFQIFVGSPRDVAKLREETFEIIEHLNRDRLLPAGYAVEAVGWDRTPHLNPTWLSPQKAIDKGLPRPSECDIAVFILWTRIGTPLSNEDYPEEAQPEGLGKALTGTEWEFFDAMNAQAEKGKPIPLTFRCIARPTISTDNYEEDICLANQREGVRQFFKHFITDSGAYRWNVIEFDGLDDFRSKLNEQLREAIKFLIRREQEKARSNAEPAAAQVLNENRDRLHSKINFVGPERSNIQEGLKNEFLEMIRNVLANEFLEMIQLSSKVRLYRLKVAPGGRSDALLIPSEDLAEKLTIRRISGLIVTHPTLGIFLATQPSDKAPTLIKGGVRTRKRKWEFDIADAHTRDYAEDEMPLSAAIREFREETGYLFKPAILSEQPIAFLYAGTQPSFPFRWGWVTFFYATVEHPRLLEFCEPKSEVLSGRWYNPGKYRADRDVMHLMRPWQKVLLLEVGDLGLPWSSGI